MAWYLQYEYDSNESGLTIIPEQVEVLLAATTEEAAIVESKTLWQKLRAEKKDRWEAGKSIRAYSSKNPFDDGPREPSLVYKPVVSFSD